MLRTPLVIVNFKAYAEATGRRAVELARVLSSASRGTGVCVAVAPQAPDLREVAGVGLPVLAQHVDPLTPGAHTGWILPEALREAGAVGSLVNHSEHPLRPEEIGRCVERLREVGLVSVVCAGDPDLCRRVASFRPDFVAVEPPELIGTGRAVSKVRPEVVSEAVRLVKGVDPSVGVLCGAGISTGEDVRKALELGAEGVLLASSVVKARDWRAAAEDVIRGARRP
ncbi:MAG: triose-phosphate isomerase [Hadesarchaea archaeon]|jgi:triosephosphate isomerase|nr:triose-phosphate isomerase [Hadesarchaea archaeon]TDA30266.1 MAG: triose-phosphate isomerase [Hadesarchaea archaeon]